MAEYDWELVAEFVRATLAGETASPESTLEAAQALRGQLTKRGPVFDFEEPVYNMMMRVHEGKLTYRGMCKEMRSLFPHVNERTRRRYRAEVRVRGLGDFLVKTQLDWLVEGDDKDALMTRTRQILHIK